MALKYNLIMLDSTVKQQINNARDILVGKIPDPKGQIDQITNALIYKFMDDQDRLALTLPGGKETFFVNELKPYAWHKLFDSKLSNQEKADLYIEGVHKLSKAKHLPELFKDIFKDAFLPFRAPDTISMFLGEINKFDYKHSENLGNAFEYLLSFLSVQGDLGSFRTPRNIIEFIVDAVDPQKEDTILDPACGTAGFLIEAYKHITQSKNLAPNEVQSLAQNIYGIEIDPGMAKIARVNLYLHGFKTPHIIEDDTLSNDNLWGKKYDVILANPPFMSPKGGIVPHDKFGVESKRAEVLFTDYIAEHLKLGGRAGVVVPEGVIFQSGTAYKQLRKMLVEDNYLWAVVSLPAGVFNPYSGVKTSILLFDRARAEKNTEVLFFQVDNDGYGLGAQRKEISGSDLPEALEVIKKWKEGKKTKSVKVLYINKKTIAESGEYKLSIDNYREAIDYSNIKWPIVELGEVAEVRMGETLIKSDLTGAGRPIFSADTSSKPWAYSEKTKLSFNKNTLVIGARGTIGSIKMPNFDDFTCTQTTIAVTLGSNVNRKYIYYQLLRYDFSKIKEGVGIPMITVKNVSKIKLPLPPLDIQHKIVEEIERYQNIIDGAEKIIDNWKPSFYIDPEWELIELKEVCHKITDGTHHTPKYTETGVPFLRVTDITESNDSKKFISATEHQELIKRCRPEKGDVLYSKNGTIGIAKLIDWDWEFSIFVSLCLLKPNKEIILPKFLEIFLNSAMAYSQAVSKKKSGTITNLHLIDIKTIKIPVVTIEKQKQIVNEIEAEKTLIDSTRKLIEVNKEKILKIINTLWE